MTEQEIDLYEVVACETCGAPAGQRCTTKGGKQTRSHACRVAVWDGTSEATV